jgi:tetratricopeptide (TPR) repeat protein
MIVTRSCVTIDTRRAVIGDTTTRAIGLVISTAYAVLIGWLYASQPQTIAQVTGGLSAVVGAYQVNQQAFDDALRFFRNEQFVEARIAFERADPAVRDARVQFYIAYAYYRQGWGRTYHDDRLYAEGLNAIDRAFALAPGGRLVVDDPALAMRTAEELKAELEAGLRVDASDLNPLRVFRTRK